MKSKFNFAIASIVLLLAGSANVFGAFMADSSANYEALTQAGSFSTSTCAWVSGDLAQVQSCATSMYSSENNCDVADGLFGMIGASAAPLPSLLCLTGSSYFVSVAGEQKVTFSVNYQDSYSIIPSTGYPRVTYWLQGTNTYTTVPLNFASGSPCSGVYSTALTLPAGIYCYYYTAKNINYPSEYDLPQSSFVVTGRPAPPANTGLINGTVTSNGKVVLRWASADPNGGTLTYQLYVGKTPSSSLSASESKTPSMQLAYQGSNTFFELDRLDYNQRYYWYVIATDQYGVSTQSPTYDFSTIGEIKKAYNYPNPFNPARNETTNIVFEMQEDGFAEVKVFSEYGNLCWQKTFYDQPKGIDQASYDGRDESGNMMYNGTYPCIIKKKYSNGEQTDHCRLLIIK